MTARNPLHVGRVLVLALGVYVASVAFSLLLIIPSVGLVGLWPGFVIAAALVVALAILAGRLLKPWYRPAPKNPQWTEDRLP